MLSFHLLLDLLSGLFPSDFPMNILLHFSSPPCALNASPISSFVWLGSLNKNIKMVRACKLKGTTEIDTKLVAYRNISRKNHEHDYFRHAQHCVLHFPKHRFRATWPVSVVMWQGEGAHSLGHFGFQGMSRVFIVTSHHRQQHFDLASKKESPGGLKLR